MSTKKLTVRIVNETLPCWYKVGEIHDVNNYISFDYSKSEPFLEKFKNSYGIRFSDCEVFSHNGIKTQTLKEYLIEKDYCHYEVLAYLKNNFKK
jgi:hypothetical protein